MSAPRSLSAAEARRIALAAQGFADRPPTGAVTARHVRRVLDRVGLFQIDSVNVLVRSHYLPLYSRLGPYPTTLLDDLAYRRRTLFEYWGHEASLLPVELQPLFRWRMARAASGEAWNGMVRVAHERPDFVEAVFRLAAERGPISAGALGEESQRAGPWWGWSDGKRALEWLYWTGRLAIAGRRSFERFYDLPERVLPSEILAAPTPTEHEAQRALLAIAARALGVATAGELADYFRIRGPLARPRVQELVEEGALVPVQVEGWAAPAYLDPAARLPRAVRARALLSPFDSLVWERSRTLRLFDFHLRLEIYTPAPKRQFGYYVLPFLLGDRLVGRVDLKADRPERTLRVLAAWAEPGQDHTTIVEPLASELAQLAGWLGLERVAIGPGGDLSAALRAVSGEP